MKDDGYFGADSITWKIGKEAILLLGGARAVMMQLAHPLVAMGVSAHSNYLQDPFGRTERTFMLGQMLTFGSTGIAQQAARTINQLHHHVYGELATTAGAYQQGTYYTAHDSELLLWVHATLIDTILHIYPLFIGPLSPDEQERYYQESKHMARLLGLAASDMPTTVQDLRHYVHDMLYSNQLAATPQARAIVQQVLFAPLSATFRVPLYLNLSITCGLLPEPLFAIYDLDWGPKRQRIFEWAAASTRKLLPYVPEQWRVLPVTDKMMQESGTVGARWHQRHFGYATHL